MQLPRDWFGPRDQLVQLRPRSPQPDAPPTGADPDGGAESNGTRAPMAVDFWGGVAAADEFVHFPGPSSDAADDGHGSDSEPDPQASVRSRSPARLRGRRAAVGLAILCLGLVSLRALSAQSRHIGRGARPKIAQVSPSAQALDFRDEPRSFGVRRLAAARKPHVAVRSRHVIGHSRASQAPSRPARSTGQPVVYSPPATTQPSVTNSAAVVSSSGSGTSGSASDGGGSGSSGGSSRSGPTGPGAAFGPGTLGK